MKKFLIFSITLLLLFSSSAVFGADLESTTINSDLFISEEGESFFDKEVLGNVFNLSNDFKLASSSVVNGSMFLMVKNNLVLESDVTYTDSLGKDNEPSIDRINVASEINGNVYVVCSDLTIKPGVKINGDLYIIAKRVNIEKSSIIHGNIFAIADNFTLNGRVENSVYVTAKTFATNYYSSITNDLNLTAETIGLNSVIRRNVNLTGTSVSTYSDFLTYGNLNVNSENFTFSGEVNGNTTVNSKLIDFIDKKDDMYLKCLIKGNLEYHCPQEIENIDNFVDGEITHLEYENKQNTKVKFSFKSFLLGLLTFVVYTFVVSLVFILINKTYLNKSIKIEIKNLFVSLGIGLLAVILVFIAVLLLFIMQIGASLGFTLLFAYIFLLFLSTPLFIIDIAKLLKTNLSIYFNILILGVVLYIIYQIPFIGAFLSFLFTIIGSGRIIGKIFKK